MVGMRRNSFSETKLNELSQDQTRGADLSYVAQPASDKAKQKRVKPFFPTSLYPEIEPNSHGMLGVGDGHTIYYEECGQTTPEAPVALFLHGGPGGGASMKSRQFFDPKFYRIIILDQRGCGRSTPNAADDWELSLFENNTQKLVSDLEKLRQHLSVEQFYVVLGGSWGSTLALAYAEAHPSSMKHLVLRGVFLFSPDEVDALFQNGSTSGQNPEAWEKYVQFIEDTSDDINAERTNYLGAYFKRLRDDKYRVAAASAFVGYELSISKSFIDIAAIIEDLSCPSRLIPFALFEVVYMLNAGFMRRGQLLDELSQIIDAGHSVSIIHGRADYVCQPKAAYILSQALKKGGAKSVNLEFVAGAGHSDSEPGLQCAIVEATDRLKDAFLESSFESSFKGMPLSRINSLNL